MEGEHGERAREIIIYNTVINMTVIGWTDKFRRLSRSLGYGARLRLRQNYTYSPH